MARISDKRLANLVKKNNRNSILPIIELLKRNETKSKRRHHRLTAKLNRILEALESAKSAPSLDCPTPTMTELRALAIETPVLEESPIPLRKSSPRLGNKSISNRRRTYNQQLRSRFFSLPPELRNEIYDLVLISARPLINPYVQIETKRDDSTERIGDINSSVLVTCRLLYDEALPVLYQKNLFVFHSHCEVILFNSGNGGRHFSSERTQRIARATLDIDRNYYCDHFPQMALEVEGWVNGVFGDGTKRIAPPEQPSEAGYMFASLQELTLDFSKWRLAKSDHFPPSFLKGIKETNWKLKKLTIIGLEEHEEVQEDLEKALLVEPPPRN